MHHKCLETRGVVFKPVNRFVNKRMNDNPVKEAQDPTGLSWGSPMAASTAIHRICSREKPEGLSCLIHIFPLGASVAPSGE